MIINTTAGKTYAVTTQTDCTVSTADGVLIASCPAGSQTCFIAPSAEVEVSDDSALVTESFKGALGGSSASGGSGQFQTITVAGDLTAKGVLKLGENGAWIKGATNREIGMDILSVYTNGTINNLYNTGKGVFSGPAIFNAGVTMAQSLTVDGNTILKGGMGVGGAMLFYDSSGVQAAQISGEYLSPDENGVVLGNGGGMDFLRIKYNSASKYIDIQPIISGSTFCLPLLAPISVNGACSADSFQFGPNGIGFDPSNPTRVVTSGAWGFGSADFAGGVTMSQTLNVAGVATVFRCAVYDAAYSLFAVLTGEAVWQNRSSGTFGLYGDNDYSMGVTLSVGRSNGEAARIIKQNQNTPLSQTDVPNLAEGDARWVKFNNTLTDAQYTALAVKDETTLYVTDTGKIYLGSYAIN